MKIWLKWIAAMIAMMFFWSLGICVAIFGLTRIEHNIAIGVVLIAGGVLISFATIHYSESI